MSNANPLPLPSTKPVKYGAADRIGAAYHYHASATYDGALYPWGINCIIEGAERCGLPGIMTPAVGQFWPNFSSNPDPARSGFSERQTGNTYCRVMLPNSATF